MTIICIASILLLFPILLIQCTSKENRRKVPQVATPVARSRESKMKKKKNRRLVVKNFMKKSDEKISAETPETPGTPTQGTPVYNWNRSAFKPGKCENALAPSTQNNRPALRALAETQKDESTAKPITNRRCDPRKPSRLPPREEFWEDQDEDDTLWCVKSIEKNAVC